ncbi:efflux transporter outer membrane subunit [Pseudomonas gingeri]|uniref:Efflux transporter outer membrane subunit n=1 Tax=Pseudomonas gingeri TaxID=117681 RepID=A0A7Y8CLB0_9PSED|nr:efflux transporter outer membrane subunit [Pseudomonas gingeri]NWB29105.1 efflux transporter outer membrane subunit [Pseudomonas gingeri]NWC34430.1 efflux transporter outer membrane subunit [Pseudomonas gingeri]NWD06607.1 efflux transporter outer membrane subunit [Pseudomonas gingeri]NWD46436.1 efflux transporter outer membrane subunit [Pseudomonas gingeri]NWE25059.1 efflux transporter outer membrane subunit [Pseudomonas gingeri]
MKVFALNRVFFGTVWLATLLATAGCSLAPTYLKPQVSMPPAYKEEKTPPLLKPAEAGSWKAAEPAEAISRGEWWRVFDDTALNQLESQALDANQNLAAAAARLKEARALNQSARSALFPTLDAGFGPTREKVSPASQFQSDSGQGASQTMWRAQAGVSYEVDMFGRVASTVDAADADAQRSEALFHSVLLALQADVAQNYFALRELDAQAEVYRRGIELREQALKMVQQRYVTGDIADLDVARAESELATARTDGMTVQRLRAASEHSLAVLLGKTPAEFSMAANPLQPVNLRIPAGLPSSLLERRPDIAAAERAMAAANARIGVAKAAFFPSLTLTGSAGFESGSLSNLFKWSSRTFLLGPLAGTALNLPIFDGGLRKGNLANARAVYEEDVANYRQQVLVAFREVEDNLSDLRVLADQTLTQAQAVEASRRAAGLARARYTEGDASYFAVIDAERVALQSRRAAVQLEGVQAAATVNLIRALGGGWDDAAAARAGTALSQN